MHQRGRRHGPSRGLTVPELSKKAAEFLAEIEALDGMELHADDLKRAPLPELRKAGKVQVGAGRGPGGKWHRVHAQ